jgi:hypothetical protein
VKSTASLAIRPQLSYTKPFGRETAIVIDRITVSSSSTGLSYSDIATYTNTNNVEPIATLFTINTYFQVTSIEVTYQPITYMSTSTTILEFFFAVNPLVSFGTPASASDVLNYPGVKCVMANSSSFRTVIKPSRLLKRLGYPYQFVCGVTPDNQPNFRYGVLGGTSTAIIGILNCKYTYKLFGLTNNADGAMIKPLEMMHLHTKNVLEESEACDKKEDDLLRIRTKIPNHSAVKSHKSSSIDDQFEPVQPGDLHKKM